MTDPKIRTSSKNGSRIYHWEEEKLPSVTSVLGMLPKEYLRYWAAKEVALAAIEKGTVTQSDYNWLRNSPDRVRDRAGEVGDLVHDTLDRIVTGQDPSIEDKAIPFVDGFNQFTNKFQPEFIKTEETVIGYIGDYGYAGSFDAYINIDGENWLIDFKTTRSGIHPEVALQLAAYANADKIIHPDGSHEDMVPVDRLGVLWLRPDNWKFVEMNFTPDLMTSFEGLLYTWHYKNSGIEKRAMGEVLASGTASSAPF